MDFSDETWDAFFDWIQDDVEDLSDAEIDERLAELGIDVSETFMKILNAREDQLPELTTEERQAMESLGPDFVKRLLAGERPCG